MCHICLTIFLTHGVPNTPQVKPAEDNCEAYFTQHVSNVTLCGCQIYSVVQTFLGTYCLKKQWLKLFFKYFDNFNKDDQLNLNMVALRQLLGLQA
jgi:hypothetical protein